MRTVLFQGEAEYEKDGRDFRSCGFRAGVLGRASALSRNRVVGVPQRACPARSRIAEISAALGREDEYPLSDFELKAPSCRTGEFVSYPGGRFRVQIAENGDYTFEFEMKKQDMVVFCTLESFDRVEVFLYPRADMSEAYCCIEIGLAGDVLDYRARYYRKMDYAFSLKTLKVNTHRSADGQVVEFSVSERELAEAGIKPEAFRLGVFRADFAPGGR